MIIRKTLKETIEWSKAIGIAILLLQLLNMFIVQFAKVSGPSMEPTLKDKQYLLVSKYSTGVNYNDFVLIDPQTKEKRGFFDNLLGSTLVSGFYTEYWVKRVIGRPHDQLEFKNGKLYRNGVLLEEPYLLEQEMKGAPNIRFEVPENQIYVMGDNRNHSRDSRAIGPIPLTHVIGKVMRGGDQ
jgi:signal peptidase I